MVATQGFSGLADQSQSNGGHRRDEQKNGVSLRAFATCVFKRLTKTMVLGVSVQFLNLHTCRIDSSNLIDTHIDKRQVARVADTVDAFAGSPAHGPFAEAWPASALASA